MILKRNSLAYNLMIFPFKNEREDNMGNLCKFFWFTLGNVIMWLAVSWFAGMMLGGLFGWLAYVFVFHTGASLLWTGVILLALYGFFRYIKWLINPEQSVIGEYFRTYKNNHCPPIDYTN